MTDEEMRIAIAEACGWKHLYTRPGETERHQKKWRYLSDLPNYLNDLNACAEFEKTLVPIKWQEYRNILQDISDWRGSVAATARQRAEAFIRTLNLWKD